MEGGQNRVYGNPKTRVSITLVPNACRVTMLICHPGVSFGPWFWNQVRLAHNLSSSLSLSLLHVLIQTLASSSPLRLFISSFNFSSFVKNLSTEKCHVKNKDIWKFLDGIYVSEKGTIVGADE
uniref:Uncharacterized protein n=1 Tax=Cucumis melo TaxID=3656 RepID=A0A9I9EDF3_CUCME